MKIRAASVDDHDAFVRLFPELGVDDPIPDRARFAAESAPRILIAEEGDDVVGYALFEIMADTGYVRNIVSDPRHRRRGVGVALMEAMRARFVAAGARTWCLNVKPENTAALALYRRCGLAPVYRSSALWMPASVPLADPDAGLAFLPVPPGDDVALEDALGLLRGQLASARARPSRQLIQLRRDGAIAGIAVFLATIPGAFPFRVVDPALAPPLIAHLRTLAPGAPWVQVVAEDDDALRDALIGLGATVRMETLHLRGPLDHSAAASASTSAPADG